MALDKPHAAERLAARIVSLIEALRIHPHLGRAGTEPGIRELAIGGTPYIVLYRVRGKQVIIHPIWHWRMETRNNHCSAVSTASANSQTGH
ncbi:MAG: type II toxin-antitoxin system RelE/ParE family toxin [Terriglobia bacterium]